MSEAEVLSYSGALVLLKDRGGRHRSYKHYTSFARARSVFDSEQLYLSDGHAWNDVQDAKRFNSPMDEYKHFGMSFSWLSAENIAMWMLYGGVSRQGAMIDFPHSFPGFIQGQVSEVEFGAFDENGFSLRDTLSVKDGIEISFVDVAYADFGEQIYRGPQAKLRVGDVRFLMSSETILSELRSLHYMKAVPWFYETETRLVLSVPKEKLCEGVTTARLLLPGLQGLIDGRIYTSPRDDGCLGAVDERFRRSTRKSLLTGQVDWDLCAACPVKSRESEV